MAEAVRGNVVYFPGVQEEDVYTNLSTDYAEQHSGVIVDACLRLGLDPQFASGFSQHLNDLNLILVEDVNSQAEQKGVIKQSRLGIDHLSSVPLHRREQTGRTVELEWDRLLIASQAELLARSKELENAFEEFGFGAPSQRALGSVALDWVFAEQSMSALGNACYMERTFTGYKKDFNGQSPIYNTHYTVSLEFLKGLEVDDSEANVADDFARLQQGFGLMMLHGSLMAREVVTRSSAADWIIEEVKAARPRAYGAPAVARHLQAVKPIEQPERPYQDYFLHFLDDHFDDEL